jgi:hypothetical protein
VSTVDTQRSTARIRTVDLVIVRLGADAAPYGVASTLMVFS